MSISLSKPSFVLSIQGNASDYVNKCHELLVEGGKVAGLLFATQFAHQGPPFGGDPETYKALFGPKFTILEMDFSPLSIAPRRGREVFFVMSRQ